MAKLVKTEILPSPSRIFQESVQAPINEEMLNALVERKVAEIYAAREQFVFEPFFRTRTIANEVKRLQTVTEKRRYSRFFEQHGCWKCERRDSPHFGLGHCVRCYNRFRAELIAVDRELTDGPREPFRYDYAAMGRKGGNARTEKLSPEERSESARNAVNKRWDKVRLNEGGQ